MQDMKNESMARASKNNRTRRRDNENELKLISFRKTTNKESMSAQIRIVRGYSLEKKTTYLKVKKYQIW